MSAYSNWSAKTGKRQSEDALIKSLDVHASPTEIFWLNTGWAVKLPFQSQSKNTFPSFQVI